MLLVVRRDGHATYTHESSTNTTPSNHDDHGDDPSSDQGGDHFGYPLDTQSSPRCTTQ